MHCKYFFLSCILSFSFCFTDILLKIYCVSLKVVKCFHCGFFLCLILETIPHSKVIKYLYIFSFKFLNFAFYIQSSEPSRIDFRFHVFMYWEMGLLHINVPYVGWFFFFFACMATWHLSSFESHFSDFRLSGWNVDYLTEPSQS